MIHGIDVSFANGAIDWKAVAESKRIGFAYARVSYGTNPADDDGPTFTANHDGCKANGIPMGAYWFWLMGQDGTAQAQHFLDAANGRYGELLPMVDVEEGSGAEGWGDSVQARIENLAAALETIRRGLAEPIIYTNADTWDTYFAGTDAFSGHRLWVANYPAQPGHPAMPAGWKSWVIHQYDSKAPDIPGITSERLDYDVLNADSPAPITR